MSEIIELFLHLDVHLAEFVAEHGAWVYGLLFAIVFAETGLVVTPFLPGDSLLFAVGALSANGTMSLPYAATLLTIAAIAGDAVNYHIGRWAGPRVFRAEDTSGWLHKALNRRHLDRAHAFFEKHGGKAIVMARFVPIVRTFVPFVAGAGVMSYPKFAFYNVTGAILWVGACVGAGYAFGNVPVVKDNFTLVVLGIIGVSVLPVVVELWKSRKGPATS